MARIRLLHPGFFTDSKVLKLAPLERLLFAGLWGVADRLGVFEDKPEDLSLQLLPRDPIDVDAALDRMQVLGLICRYSLDGSAYGWLRAFLAYQRPHKNEAASDRPLPDAPGCLRRALPNGGNHSLVVPGHNPGSALPGGVGVGVGEEGAPPSGQRSPGRAKGSRDPFALARQTVTEIAKDADVSAPTGERVHGFREAQDRLCSAHLAVTGRAYRWERAKDSLALKRLLAATEAGEIEVLWRYGLGLPDGTFPSIATVAQLDQHFATLRKQLHANGSAAPLRFVPL